MYYAPLHSFSRPRARYYACTCTHTPMLTLPPNLSHITQAWALLLWSLASAGHQPWRKTLLLQMRGEMMALPVSHPADTRPLGILLWVLGALDMYDKELVTWISTSARPGSMEPGLVAACLWALAAMPEGTLAQHAELTKGLVEAANASPVAAFGGRYVFPRPCSEG